MPLIECGTLKNVIVDSRNAKKYSLKKTGNGHRSFDTSVSLEFNTLSIGKGTKTTEEILNGLERCIFVEVAAGGEFTDKGDYSTPIQGAYLLEKGIVKGRLPQITMTTSIQKMFDDDLIAVASDSVSMYGPNPSIFVNAEILIN